MRNVQDLFSKGSFFYLKSCAAVLAVACASMSHAAPSSELVKALGGSEGRAVLSRALETPGVGPQVVKLCESLGITNARALVSQGKTESLRVALAQRLSANPAFTAQAEALLGPSLDAATRGSSTGALRLNKDNALKGNSDTANANANVNAGTGAGSLAGSVADSGAPLTAGELRQAIETRVAKGDLDSGLGTTLVQVAETNPQLFGAGVRDCPLAANAFTNYAHTIVAGSQASGGENLAVVMGNALTRQVSGLRAQDAVARVCGNLINNCQLYGPAVVAACATR